jgi:16S rRNA (adenine1518-N6/adenine1519-N6)-dimethyltransferase
VDNINLLRKTKYLLRLHKIFPKKRFGQNFIINPEIFQRLVSFASLSKDDVVLEVGAGFGFLTQLLSKECKKVIAVEIDPRLIAFLRKNFVKINNIDLIEGDILNISLPSFNKVVAAPPYSISSPLLFRLLENSFDSAFLIFQKEFAERLSAQVATKDYSRLTVTIYYRAIVKLLDYVPRTMFYPQPDVDSIIVNIKPRTPPFYVEDEELFFKIVRAVFTQRNRKLRNALIPFLRILGINRKDTLKLADSIIYSEKRVRELAPENFGILTNELLKKIKSEYPSNKDFYK